MQRQSFRCLMVLAPLARRASSIQFRVSMYLQDSRIESNITAVVTLPEQGSPLAAQSPVLKSEDIKHRLQSYLSRKLSYLAI